MYVNYGDVNFFEYGCLVDSEHSDTEFRILYCRPFDDEDDLYLFGDCTVNIEDDWIDRDAVLSYIGMMDDTYEEGKFDATQFAIGCIEYYGVDEFRDYYLPAQMTKDEVCRRLKNYLIASDNLNIEW